MEIHELVAEVQRGNKDAFAEVYELYVDRIFRFVKLKVSNQEQAADIVQEVFIKAWRGCQSLRLDGLNFSAWLYKIASNTVNDYFRKMYRTPEIAPLESTAELVASASLEAETNTALDLERMRASLQELPTQYRQVLELRFVQDFTITETAEILGRTSLAVRVLQHRAINKLESIMSKNNQSSYESI